MADNSKVKERWIRPASLEENCGKHWLEQPSGFFPYNFCRDGASQKLLAKRRNAYDNEPARS